MHQVVYWWVHRSVCVSTSISLCIDTTIFCVTTFSGKIQLMDNSKGQPVNCTTESFLNVWINALTSGLALLSLYRWDVRINSENPLRFVCRQVNDAVADSTYSSPVTSSCMIQSPLIIRGATLQPVANVDCLNGNRKYGFCLSMHMDST